jgi:uncharacterized membrane protein YgcG
MPSRLVYAPQCQAYTKDAAGDVWNLTDYVVSGQVQRLINQASTASLVLRNPKKKFTATVANGDNPAHGALFHPMDAITIFLQRLENLPVQVFTGYLDETPYYQMYPGTITLSATCTLKKLIFMYFDPSLPYVANFLAKMGWQYGPTDGSLMNFSTLGQGTVEASKALADGGIAQLLWAVLTDIGQWDDSDIWIEELPTGVNGIASRIAQLMLTLDINTQVEAQEFTTFMNALIGAGPQGSGGGSAGGGGGGGGSTGGGGGGSSGSGGGVITTSQGLTIKTVAIDSSQAANLNTAFGVAQSIGTVPTVALWAMVFAGIAENSWYATTDASNPTHHGVFQSTYFSTTDVAGAAKAFLQGGPSFGGSGGAIGMAQSSSDPIAIAEALEVGGSYASEAHYSSFLPEAKAIVSQYLTGTGVNHSVPGHAPSAAATLTNPIPGFTITAHDAGIDGTAPVTTPIFAPADCTLVNVMQGWYKSQPLLEFHFDNNMIGAMSQYWYVAEQIDPITEKIGTQFKMGKPVAHFAASGSGIEIGWGDPSGGGNGTLAGSMGKGDYGHQPSPVSNSFVSYFGIGGGTPTGTSGGASGGTTGSPSPTPGGSAGGGAGMNFSNAEAFTSQLDFPSVEEMAVAMLLGQQHEGLMNDQQLLPFVQELATASLRSFQSLPNGDFFAFYPDYFGETGHREPYFKIYDIEITNGGVNLSDQSLATHFFAVGDNTWPQVGNAMSNALFSTGEVTVYNAFLDQHDFIDTSTGATVSNPSSGSDGGVAITAPDGNGMADVMNKDEAIAFVKRYGARPQVTQYPMVRSPIYEMFLAYQGFLLAWANQFQTPFAFTFMPELFPGGKVAFPEHGLQMYIESVTHEWDVSEGGEFTTTAQLKAPARMKGTNNPELPPDMVRALVEPIHMAAAAKAKATTPGTTTETVPTPTLLGGLSGSLGSLF